MPECSAVFVGFWATLGSRLGIYSGSLDIAKYKKEKKIVVIMPTITINFQPNTVDSVSLEEDVFITSPNGKKAMYNTKLVLGDNELKINL